MEWADEIPPEEKTSTFLHSVMALMQACKYLPCKSHVCIILGYVAYSLIMLYSIQQP